MNYFIYEILVDGVRRYVGMTNDLSRREKEHNRGLKSGEKKTLYKKLYLEGKAFEEIKLNKLYEFVTKTDAVRMEAYLILEDWFNEKELWQAPPRAIKYF
jgi:predicted GIY-YIG superfamily endonuclease